MVDKKRNVLLRGKGKVIEKVAKFKFRPKKKVDMKVRHLSQKQANILFVGSIAAIVLLAGLVIVSNGIRTIFNNQDKSPRIIKTEKTKEFSNQVNLFMSDYLYAYFNREKDSDLDKLSKYYGAGIDIKNQDNTTHEMELTNVRLVEIKPSVAIYDITYQIKTDDDWKVTSTRICIPYKSKGGRYYVSDLPYYRNLRSYTAKNVKESFKLPSQTEVQGISDRKIEKLRDYLTAFFKAYVSGDPSNTAPFSKSVVPVSGYRFESLDYTYFVKKKHSVAVVVQVTLKDELGVKHQENFSFNVVESKQTSSYYVKSMKHGIDEELRKEMKLK